MCRVSIALLALWPLAACGTVSMVSTQALVETNFAAEKSSLEQVCDSYTEKAQTAQWVAPSAGLFGLARTLVDGETDNGSARNAYVDELFLASSDPIFLLDQIVSDVEQARTGLEIVTEEAEASVWSAVLIGDDLRAEMMSYEMVLVTAQKSRRTFLTARQAVMDAAAPAAPGHEDLDGALLALDLAIDEARQTADRLATAYEAAVMTPGPSS